MALTGDLARRDVLRYEILLRTRHAVIVCPAIDRRERGTKVSVFRRSIRSLPLKRGRVPGVAARRLALEIAPDQVVQEYQLHAARNQGGDGDPLVQVVRRC